MTFWIIAIGAAVLVAAAIVRPLLSRPETAAPRAAHDAQVFRDQLKELKKEVARGVISPEDAEATRLEISRRLLAADEEGRLDAGASSAPRGLSRALAAILLIAAPVSAAMLYYEVGAPGVRDAPLTARADTARPSQEAAEAMVADRPAPEPPAGADADAFRRQVAQLEDRLKTRPDDAQGVLLYARSLMNLARFKEAYAQFDILLTLREGDAEIEAGRAESMILAAGGYVSPEAEEALLAALRWDPLSPVARYYLGRAHAQAGKADAARTVWMGLLQTSPPDAPWVAPIQSELARLGDAGEPIAQLPGPTRDEMEAAAEIPPEDRAEMVRNMVEGLAERLYADGGTIEEWQRLIRSYNVLGQPKKAREAMDAARKAYAGDVAALSRLENGGAPQQPGAPMPGPSAEEMAAASDMSTNDRAAMIEGMVGRLRERLYDQGGSVEEWLRLISSYAVMGQRGEAEAAYERARAAFADDAASLSILESAVEGGPRSAQPAAPATDDRGPTQADIAAAAEMEASDRQEMIRGMVSQLHDRLREEGRVADVNDWGKLMRSYNVLGQTDAVRDAYDEAIQIYADDAIGLAYLKEAALLSGAKIE